MLKSIPHSIVVEVFIPGFLLQLWSSIPWWPLLLIPFPWVIRAHLAFPLVFQLTFYSFVQTFPTGYYRFQLVSLFYSFVQMFPTGYCRFQLVNSDSVYVVPCVCSFTGWDQLSCSLVWWDLTSRVLLVKFSFEIVFNLASYLASVNSTQNTPGFIHPFVLHFQIN